MKYYTESELKDMVLDYLGRFKEESDKSKKLRYASRIQILGELSRDYGYIDLVQYCRDALQELMKAFDEHPSWYVQGSTKTHNILYGGRALSVVFHGKHEDNIKIAISPEERAAVFLNELKYRLESGYFMEEHEDPPSNQLDMFKNNEIPLTEADQVRQILDFAHNKCLMRAGREAYNLLAKRQTFEYESFDYTILNKEITLSK